MTLAGAGHGQRSRSQDGSFTCSQIHLSHATFFIKRKPQFTPATNNACSVRAGQDPDLKPEAV